jgi:hypothetical protein
VVKGDTGQDEGAGYCDQHYRNDDVTQNPTEKKVADRTRQKQHSCTVGHQLEEREQRIL